MNDNQWNQGPQSGAPYQRGRVYANVEPRYDDSYNRSQQPPPQPKKPKKKGMVAAGVALALAGSIVGSVVTGFVMVPMIASQYVSQAVATEQISASGDPAEAPSVENLPAATEDSTKSSSPSSDDDSVVAVAEDLQESVVGVIVSERQLVRGQEPVEQDTGSGTGFIISEDGYVVTNNHVASAGSYARIRMHDGTEYPATVVGTDEASDIAVLKVNAEGVTFKAAKLGDSTQTKAGEKVVAIGNPLGSQLSNTVTVGYVSAVGREVVSNKGGTTEMIQTDAAINPGNSGGPLVNMDGEVIGITTQKSVFAGVDAYGNAIPSEGIGFAIPMSNAEVIINQLMNTGSVSDDNRPGVTPEPARIGIGISYSMITAEDSELWGTPMGVLVEVVAAGGPADQAGIQQYDIITAIDGTDLTQGAEIPSFESKSVGDKVSATIWRNGQEVTVELELADLNKLSS